MSKGKHLNVSQSPESVQGFTPEDYLGEERFADGPALLKMSRYRIEQSRRLQGNSPENLDCCLYDF